MHQAKRFGLKLSLGERWELSLATFQENKQPAVELLSDVSAARTQLTSQKWSRMFCTRKVTTNNHKTAPKLCSHDFNACLATQNFGQREKRAR